MVECAEAINAKLDVYMSKSEVKTAVDRLWRITFWFTTQAASTLEFYTDRGGCPCAEMRLNLYTDQNYWFKLRVGALPGVQWEQKHCPCGYWAPSMCHILGECALLSDFRDNGDSYKYIHPEVPIKTSLMYWTATERSTQERTRFGSWVRSMLSEWLEYCQLDIEAPPDDDGEEEDEDQVAPEAEGYPAPEEPTAQGDASRIIR